MNQLSGFLSQFEQSYSGINKQLDVLDKRVATCKKAVNALDPRIMPIDLKKLTQPSEE
jgi:hypothetical protein